ncbi:hypothetical protein Lal_00020206 [Lupinus albus]|nr:hypothetical protein Lal_00020206 [Lupinus albus]
MESEGNINTVRKPRFLCLHGFRTSAEIHRKQMQKWPQSLLDNLDLVYVDAPFPCQGKSAVEGLFDPPYYEWFQYNNEFTEYKNLDECLEYIEECMIKYGPFDGLLGFSQGGILAAALPGLQEKGVALTNVPKVKFLIIIGGGKFKSPSLAEKAYPSPITCPSLHFLGEKDFMKAFGKEVIETCVEPVVVHHPKGHTVPLLDEENLKIVMSFIERIKKIVENEEGIINISSNVVGKESTPSM